MFAIKVDAKQIKLFTDALDLVVMTHGIACLNDVLPLLSAVQRATPEAEKSEVEQRPDLKVVSKEAASKD